MSSNSFGKNFVVTCFGESHGRCIGVVIDGCPPGLELSKKDVQVELNKRRPPLSPIFTSRYEEDRLELLSGVKDGKTTGAPICVIVWNREMDSRPYEKIKRTPRPGHADYPAWVRYKGYNDYRGGGRFSGRITISYIMAGAVAKKLLKRLNIEVLAHVIQIGHVKIKKDPKINEIRANVYSNLMRCADPYVAKLMEKIALKVKDEGDSVGGIVEGLALNVPPGIGQPIIDSLDADIAKILFDIPAVKGVEFGAGFQAAALKGSQNNDEYAIINKRVTALTNNAGGILGGLSTGMPIKVRVAFKPPSSISKPQQTVNLRDMIETTIEVKGRHDVCIVPRAVPIVESVIAITLTDHLLSLAYLGEK